MTPSRDPSHVAALLALAAACALGAVAPVQAGNPPIQMAPQGVEYMCGGRTADEIAFMEQVAPHWAATLEFAVSHAPRGRFAQTVQVRVVDKYHGHAVMQARSDGPLMLARLQPGTYDVEATVGDLTLTQTLTVALGVPGKALFLWPSNVDMTAAAMPHQAVAQGR